MGLYIQVSMLNGMHSKAGPRWKRSFRWGPWVLGPPRVHACMSPAGPVLAHPLHSFPAGGDGAPISRRKTIDDGDAGGRSAWLRGDEANSGDWGSDRPSATSHPDALVGGFHVRLLSTPTSGGRVISVLVARRSVVSKGGLDYPTRHGGVTPPWSWQLSELHSPENNLDAIFS